jgi:hypothetical protein
MVPASVDWIAVGGGAAGEVVLLASGGAPAPEGGAAMIFSDPEGTSPVPMPEYPREKSMMPTRKKERR